MIKIFPTVFLISIFGSISASFPFNLSNIADAEENNCPNIIKMSIDDSFNRPIGAYPVDYKSNISDSTSLKTPVEVTAHFSVTPQNKKRKTAQVKAITADMTIDEIIEVEVKESGFHKEEKRAQFRKTLQLIARNDREAFDADEKKFKTVFGKLYDSFKKD